jgi:sugar-phosphatase
MIEAAIFDMDGLLIDSEPFWRKSHIAAVAEHGVSITEDDVRRMAGRRTDEVVRHWRDIYNLKHVPNETLEMDVVGRVIEEIQCNGRALPGVGNLMTLFKKRHVPIAVASSSSPEVIEAVLSKLKLSDHIQLSCSAKHEAFGKPHPGVFITAALKLGVDAARCIVFEDSLNGVRAAKAARMKCVAVPEAANLKKPEFYTEADLVVPSLKQLNWTTLSKLFKHA